MDGNRGGRKDGGWGGVTVGFLKSLHWLFGALKCPLVWVGTVRVEEGH